MKRWLIAIAWLLCSAGANSEALFSNTTPNINGSGIMFDMTALNDITITGFVSALTTVAGTHSFGVYTKAGTHVGFETNPGAWTPLGTSTFAFSGGQLDRTFDFAVSVPIAAGTTRSFYFNAGNSLNYMFSYSVQGALGDVVAADANMQWRIGSRVLEFSAPAGGRAFTGTVIYRSAATVPTAVTPISGTPQGVSPTSALAPLTVRVTGPGGVTIPFATVTFATPGAGASAVLSAPGCVTDAVGECSIGATANAVVGPYNVQAMVAGVVAPATFALTNLGTPLAAGIVSVPTLGQWAMATLAVLLGAMGVSRRLFERRGAPLL